ncbi:twin-arginine translocase TatA/TatE family subunit [Dehalococcoidia bacterium]|nr:twin-arginine translocase TatA/TatE family subunit [Dehalococcoidia bacterium]
MDFLGIGAAEFLVIALVAFLILGPTRMNEMARNIGKLIREIRQTTNDIPALLSPEEPLDQPPTEFTNIDEDSDINARKSPDSR